MQHKTKLQNFTAAASFKNSKSLVLETI